MNTAPSVSNRLIPLSVLRSEPRQIVIAKLIDHDEQNQPSVRTDGGLSRRQCYGEQQNCDEDGAKLFHETSKRRPKNARSALAYAHSIKLMR